MHVVCPGSFDPITYGHIDIIERAAAQFEKVTVLVTFNPNKDGLFSVEERCSLIEEALAHLDNVVVDSWDQLLVKYTTAHGIKAMVKGLRSSLDYAYELPMAQMNRSLSGIDTFFLLTTPKYGHISSTLCKEVARYGGDVSELMPHHVIEAMNKKITAEG